MSDDYVSGMDFCKGMPMTMSMGGFQSTLFSKDRPSDCITFLFSEWKLDRPGKFVGAMICTFAVATVTEGIAYFQPHVRNKYLAGKSKYQRKSIMTLIYGFQQLLGWLLMLISMTFSIELFVSVVLGLFFGKLIFPAESSAIQNDIGRIRRSSDVVRNESPLGENDPLLPEEPLVQSSSSQSSDTSSDNAIRRRRR